MTTEKNFHQHCFKIITPKRTYLVSSPSEEDEIKWLAALQCLVARKATAPSPPSLSDLPPAASPVVSASSRVRVRSMTDAARLAVREVERRFHPAVGS